MPLDATAILSSLSECDPPRRYEGFESEGEKGWSKRFDEQIGPPDK